MPHCAVVRVLRVLPPLSDLAAQVTPFVVVGSWLCIWVQLLFPVLMLWKPTRYAALIVIMGMHLAIGLFLGLWTMIIAEPMIRQWSRVSVPVRASRSLIESPPRRRLEPRR